jgi:hypothetical protein
MPHHMDPDTTPLPARPAAPEFGGAYRTAVDGSLVEASEALARVLGYRDRAELLAEGLPLPLEGRPGRLARLRREGAQEGQAGFLTRRDGRPTQVVFSERLIRDGAGRELVEGTLIEVAARGGEGGDRLLSALAGGVARGVSEPLATVSANLGFAIETLAGMEARTRLEDGDATAELDRALRDAKRGADALRQVLSGLTVFARPPGGASADLRRTLESAVTLVAAELDGRIHLTRELDDTPPVAAGEALLGPCLLQILLAALDAMADGRGGHRLRVACRVEGRRAVVEIEDSARRAPDADEGAGLLGAHVVVAAARGTLALWPGRDGGRLVRVELPLAP